MLSRNASASAFIRANSSRVAASPRSLSGDQPRIERGDIAGKLFKARADKLHCLRHWLTTHKLSDSGPAARCHETKNSRSQICTKGAARYTPDRGAGAGNPEITFITRSNTN